MKYTPRVAVDVRNELGEGIVWHAGRQQLIWFDIYRNCAFIAGADGSGVKVYGFAQRVSAAFIIDNDTLLIASSTGLLSLDLASGETAIVKDIESAQADTRSNDSRVGPGNCIWFSTMSDSFEKVGTIYHYRNGELTTVFRDLSCPNSICFSPSGDRAYFSDTFEHKIMTCSIDSTTGLPTGSPEVFVDLTAEGACPDGAVVDSEGCLWCALWGSGQVVRYRADASVDTIVDLPVPRTTCPCLGGPDLKTLYVTTMANDLKSGQVTAHPLSGAVFAIDVDVAGLPERAVNPDL